MEKLILPPVGIKYALFPALFFVDVSINASFAQNTLEQGLVIEADLSLISDDNALRNNTELSDNIIQLSPKLSYLNAVGKHQFSATYSGGYRKYSDLSQFDYDNHNAKLGILFNHSYRFSSKFEVSHQDEVEQPGSNNGTLGDISEFNQFDRSEVLASLFYGTEQSKGQIVLELGYRTVDYSNNNQSFRNTDVIGITGSYFYRIAPRTRALLEIGTADYDYTDANFVNDQSNQQNTYLAGIEWQTSEQIKSVFKVGYQTKEFENNEFDDIDGLSYSLDFTWLPLQYTQVIFGVARTTNESAIEGTPGFVSKSFSVGLKHQVSELFTLESRLEQANDELSFRTDKSSSYDAGITYEMRYWLDIKLNYTVDRRESDELLFDYDSQVFQLSLIAKFD